jgi:hypothetical protein
MKKQPPIWRSVLALWLVGIIALWHPLFKFPQYSVPQVTGANAGSSGGSAAPTLVQKKLTYTDTQTQSQFSGSNAYIPACLPNAGISGNTIIVALVTNEATIGDVTVTDNESETYALANDEIAGSRTLAVYYFAGIASGAQCITVTWSTGGGVANDQIEISEWANIATSSTVDTSGKATVTSGTAPACGSITTTKPNDLIFDVSNIVSFSSKPTGSMTFTAQTGGSWNLLDADGTSWMGTQTEVLSATGAVNPAITLSRATTRTNVVCVAFAAASSGGVPGSGIHLNSVTWSDPQYGYSTAFATSTLVMQMPCFGNDLWVAVAQADNTTVSGIGSDTNGNTWTGLTRVDSSGDTFALQWWHADSATCNGAEQFTITWSAAPSYVFITMYDVSGSAGYDSSATCGSGSTPCATNSTSSAYSGVIAGATITPSTSSGLILSEGNQDFQSISAVSPGTFLADLVVCPGSSGGCVGGSVGTYIGYQGSGMEQDSGAMDYYYSSSGAVSINWTFVETETTGPIEAYFSSTVAIKSQ